MFRTPYAAPRQVANCLLPGQVGHQVTQRAFCILGSPRSTWSRFWLLRLIECNQALLGSGNHQTPVSPGDIH